MNISLWKGDRDVVFEEASNDLFIEFRDHGGHGEDTTAPEVKLKDHGAVCEFREVNLGRRPVQYIGA